MAEHPRVITLTPASAVSIEASVVRDGIPEEVIINRGIQLYGYLMTVSEIGGEIWVKEHPDAEVLRMTFQ